MRGKRHGKSSAPPVNVGDELDVKIESVGEKGDGIAKIKGFVLFVQNVREGETCRVRVSKVLERVGFADKIGEAKSEPIQSKPRRELPPEEVEPHPDDSESFGEDEEEQDVDLGLQ